MTDTPRLDAFLGAQRLVGDYELSDLSPQEINRLSMANYAKIRERAGLDPIDPFATAYSQYEPEHQAPEQPPAPVQEPQSAPQGIDLANMTMQEYAAVRGQLGVGGREYGTGIMNPSGSQSWAEAASAKSGRTGLNNSNVTEPPQIRRAFIQHTQVAGRQSWYRGN